MGWADVATRHDLAALEQRMELRFTHIEERFDERFNAVLTMAALAFALVRFT